MVPAGCISGRLARQPIRGRVVAVSQTAFVVPRFAHIRRAVGCRAVSEAAKQDGLRVADAPVPRSIADIDNGNLLGFGADLGEDHPGYPDNVYKQRRVWISKLAKEHKIGEPVPHVNYTPEEVNVWNQVLEQVSSYYPQYACKEFNDSFKLFGFRPNEVPQLEDMSKVLQATTAWRVRPTAGLLHPRDFLNGLAFKYFHSTQYVRHHSKPSYTPEPDVCHELLGHVPMLAHPEFADMVHQIGIASLGASDKDIWHLIKVYWYTVEFGVVREGDSIKAFGAGILSSFGELQHMGSGAAQLEPFDPFAAQPKMSYKDGYQKRYFVLASFAEGARQLREFAAHMQAKRAELLAAN